MKIFNLIITTKKKEDDLILSCLMRLEKINNLSIHSTINPVLSSLKELRNNTWDKQRVDNIIEWLGDYLKRCYIGSKSNEY